MSIYKLIALRNGKPFFEFPIIVNEKGDFTTGAAEAFREFHAYFPEFTDPDTDGITFSFEKA